MARAQVELTLASGRYKEIVYFPSTINSSLRNFEKRKKKEKLQNSKRKKGKKKRNSPAEITGD